MKKLLTLISFTVMVFTVKAQLNPATSYNEYLQQQLKFKQKQPLVINKLFSQKLLSLNTKEDKAINNVDNMPIAGFGEQKLSFVSNNNNGLDIYQSTPDNIFVIKPDASFTSNMSTGNYNIVPPITPAKPK